MSRPTVAVIVTSYNYERYLGAALDSVFQQTELADQVIVVDDGSVDGSRSLLREYEDRAQIILQENGGQGAAFNAAWAHVTSDVVVFLDADDLLLPNALAEIRRAWTPDLAKIHWQMDVIDATGRRTGDVHPAKVAASGDLRGVLVERPDEVVFASPPTSGNAFASAALEPAMPMDAERWRTDADTVFLTVAPLWGPVLRWDVPLSQYRLHGENASLRRRGRDGLVRGRNLVTSSMELLERLAPEVTPAFARDWLEQSWALRLLALWDLIADSVPTDQLFVLWDNWWTDWDHVDGRPVLRPWDEGATTARTHVLPWFQDDVLDGLVLATSPAGRVMRLDGEDAARAAVVERARLT